ncbi:MAG: GldG family protein [bacterium]|nr:GldG family protein [bacterium]
MTGIAALLGALGAVALGFGLLTAILALVQPVTDLTWVVANLVVGVLLLGGAVLSSLDSLRERMASGEARRVGRYGASALLGTIFTIAILGMLAFLSTRYSQRFDWTEAKINTLSEQTLELLGRLDRDVQVTAFFNAADAPPIRDLFDRYAHQSDRISLQFADPVHRPDLVQAFGIGDEDLARGLVRISIGEAHFDLTQFSESEITNALLRLTHGEDRKIYFLENHNERPFEGERGSSGPGYSQAVAALRNETYEVESLFLASAGAVPEDADLVVIAGPTRPLVDVEHQALDAFVDGGGAIMVLIDPRANTDIAVTLRKWGVEVGEDVVFDARLALFGQATSPFSGRFADHPITEKLRDTVLFHMARSVQVASGSPLLEPIVFTGEESWAERDVDGWTATGNAKYDAEDLLGPISLMIAGERNARPESEDAAGEEQQADPGRSRIVVAGDSDFASNELIGNYQNRDLFVNAVNWLVDDTDQIAIRPPVSRASRFQMTGDTFLRIQLLSLFVVPELIAVTGVFAWWMRRKRTV